MVVEDGGYIKCSETWTACVGEWVDSEAHRCEYHEGHQSPHWCHCGSEKSSHEQ